MRGTGAWGGAQAESAPNAKGCYAAPIDLLFIQLSKRSRAKAQERALAIGDMASISAYIANREWKW